MGKPLSALPGYRGSQDRGSARLHTQPGLGTGHFHTHPPCGKGDVSLLADPWARALGPGLTARGWPFFLP